MNTDRKTALITGILLIVATAASLAGSSMTAPILRADNHLAEVAANGSRLVLGALLTFLAAATSAGIALALYPLLKKHGSTLAIGAVAFRLVEAVFYIVGALCLLTLLPLSAQFSEAADAGASSFSTLAHLLLAAKDLAGFIFAVLAFCVGASLYYAVFYRTQLVPRWLSAWGLISLALLLTAVLWTLFDGEPYSVSGPLAILAAPIGLQEIVLAVWLMAKGFNRVERMVPA